MVGILVKINISIQIMIHKNRFQMIKIFQQYNVAYIEKGNLPCKISTYFIYTTIYDLILLMIKYHYHTSSIIIQNINLIKISNYHIYNK